MDNKIYGKQAVAAILDFDWSRLGNWYRDDDAGIWVVAPSAGDAWASQVIDVRTGELLRTPPPDGLDKDGKPVQRDGQFAQLKALPEAEAWSHLAHPLAPRVAHPEGDIDRPVLPFPFTLTQFYAFCDSCPLFAWDRIELIYSNDDGSLDEVALAALASVSRPAKELVCGWLARKYGLAPGVGAAPSATPPAAATLSTDEICMAFDGVGMSSMEWRTALTKNLSDWAVACRAVKGRPGGVNPVQARWDPLKVAEALVTGRSRKPGVVAAELLDKAFNRPLLRPLAEDWKRLREDHPAWGA